MRNLHEHAAAVAELGVGAGRAAMVEIDQDLQALLAECRATCGCACRRRSRRRRNHVRGRDYRGLARAAGTGRSRRGPREKRLPAGTRSRRRLCRGSRGPEKGRLGPEPCRSSFRSPSRPQSSRPVVVKLCWRILDIDGCVARSPKASRGGFFSIFFDRQSHHRRRLVCADRQCALARNAPANNAPENGQHNCPISADHDRFRSVPQVAARRRRRIF